MPDAIFKTGRKPAKVEMTVAGEWLPAPKRDWRGVIQSAETVVAIAFLRVGGHTAWCKSDRGSLHGLEVSVMLDRYDNFGLDVSASFSIGNNGPRWRTLVESANYFPKIIAPKTFLTGQLIDFAKVEGNPRIDLNALFIARKDVRVGRNGLWHLRKELVEFFPESFRKILAYGRSGAFDS